MTLWTKLRLVKRVLKSLFRPSWVEELWFLKNSTDLCQHVSTFHNVIRKLGFAILQTICFCFIALMFMKFFFAIFFFSLYPSTAWYKPPLWTCEIFRPRFNSSRQRLLCRRLISFVALPGFALMFRVLILTRIQSYKTDLFGPTFLFSWFIEIFAPSSWPQAKFLLSQP